MGNSWVVRGAASLAGAWRESSAKSLSDRSPRLALFLGALLLAAFSTGWLLLQSPDFFSGYDFVRMHAFYKAFFRESLLAGRLPLWNPYVGLGRPFLADIETETLYPPNLLVLPLGVRGGVALSLLLHQAVAIYCGARLGRMLGASAVPSMLLGAGLALASPFTARLATGAVPVYFSLCWWPALLLLGARLQDRWSRREAARFAVVSALAILAGNPPVLFLEIFGLAVFLVLRVDWPAGGAGWGSVLRNHCGLALAGVLGAGLACVELLPAAELIGQGNRPLHSAGFAVANGMPAASWLSLIFPTSVSFGPNWEYDLYCGLVPLFAALGGLLLWRERNVRALLGLGLAGALLAAGDRAPFLGWVVHVVPGASALRIPSRYGIWLATALLGLAAVSLSRTPRRPIPLLLAGLAASAAWMAWLRPYAAGPGEAGRFCAIHIGALAAAALLVGLWHARARLARHAGPLALALCAFCAADYLLAIRLQAPVYSKYGFRTDEEGVRSGLEAAGLLGKGRAPPRISFNSSDLCENAGMALGFSTYNSYANPGLARVWTYLHLAAGLTESAGEFIRLPQAIDMNPGRFGSLSLVADLEHPSRVLVIHPERDPRAYVVFAAEEVADWRSAEERMAAGAPFHDRALLEPGAPRLMPDPVPHTWQAEITRFEPERVVVRTRADAPGALILGEAWYPGWSASVSGRPTDAFPANGWMRGATVGAGQSEVVFAYRSRLLASGLGISLLCAAVLAALALGPEPGQTDSRIL